MSCRTVVNRWTDNGLANIIPLLPIADGSTAGNTHQHVILIIIIIIVVRGQTV